MTTSILVSLIREFASSPDGRSTLDRFSVPMIVRPQPELAWLVDRMSLYDQLDLTLELLHADTWHDEDTWPEDERAAPAPSNIVRFRRRRTC
jgi:hypothetical protein